MADVYVDILEPKQDPDESIKLLQTFAPLYQKYWNETQRSLYSDKPFDLHIQLFSDLWFTGGSKIFIAYDRATKEMRGFIVGIAFRPMTYNGHVFQIEDMYDAGDLSIRSALIEYMFDALRFLGCDEVRIDGTLTVPDRFRDWHVAASITTTRYAK